MAKQNGKMELLQKAKGLPTTPGVYLMKDSLKNVIYVGKAKDLRNRVVQYFRENGRHVSKIQDMIGHVRTFETIGTDTELEAFLLECRLIKEIKPRYNKQMKNHENYCYMEIPIREVFPCVVVATGKPHESSIFFGPFVSPERVENAVAFIREQFPIRKCGSSPLAKRTSGCLNYQLGSCPGPCTGYVPVETYRDDISRIVAFLEGGEDTPLREMQKKMAAAAERLEFERAAQYRDWIRGIQHVLYREKMIRKSQTGKSVVAIELIREGSFKLFLIRGNKLLYSERIAIGKPTERKPLEQQLEILLRKTFCKTSLPPNRRLDKEEIDEAQIIDSYLRRKHGIFYRDIPVSYLGKDRNRLKDRVRDMVDFIFENREL